VVVQQATMRTNTLIWPHIFLCRRA
jgi:hypothetical protein